MPIRGSRCLALVPLFVLAIASTVVAAPLINADIMRMHRAGIGADALVALAEGSPGGFDIAPDAIIELKKAGVPDAVITAMILAHSGGAHSDAAPSAQGSGLPSAYGMYVTRQGSTQLLPAQPVTTRLCLTVRGGDRGAAVDGLAEEAAVTVSSPDAIIVYRQGVNVEDLHVSRLEFDESVQAGQVNILGTNPAFFSNLYGMSPSSRISIRLWRPSEAVRVQVEPIAGHSDMYRLVPVEPLPTGQYALWLGNDVHGGDIVFTASRDRQAEAWQFAVVPAPVEAPADVKGQATPGASEPSGSVHPKAGGGQAMTSTGSAVMDEAQALASEWNGLKPLPEGPERANARAALAAKVGQFLIKTQDLHSGKDEARALLTAASVLAAVGERDGSREGSMAVLEHVTKMTATGGGSVRAATELALRLAGELKPVEATAYVTLCNQLRVSDPPEDANSASSCVYAQSHVKPLGAVASDWDGDVKWDGEKPARGAFTGKPLLLVMITNAPRAMGNTDAERFEKYFEPRRPHLNDLMQLSANGLQVVLVTISAGGNPADVRARARQLLCPGGGCWWGHAPGIVKQLGVPLVGYPTILVDRAGTIRWTGRQTAHLSVDAVKSMLSE